MGNDISAMDVLKNTPFAMYLSPDVVHDISICFTSMRFKPGATIAFAKQEFLIVAKGSADVSTILPHAQKKVKVMELLCKKKVGDILTHCSRGRFILQRKSASSADLTKKESAAMEKKNVAAMLDLVTVTADKSDGCILLRLNRDKFVKVRAGHMMNRVNTNVMSINRAQRTAEDDWRLISTIADDQVVDYLAAVPFFSEVKSSRLAALAGLCTFEIARKDQVVCRENDFGNKFYICISGMLAVTVTSHVSHTISTHGASTHVATHGPRRSVDGHRPSISVSEVLIRRIGDGSYFGEISLILSMRRSATVTAIEDSLLVYIEASAFRNFLKVCPDIKVELEHVVVNRLLQIASKSPSAQFLAALSTEDQERLASIGQLEEVAKGTKIVLLEDDNPQFYIVLNGKIEIEVGLPSGNMFINMGPGGYFGELSIILQTKSLIQATAREDCVLLSLNPTAFHGFFSTLPELFSEFAIKYLQMDATLEHVINHYDAHELWLVYLEGRPDNYESKIRYITNGVLFCEDVDEYHYSCPVLNQDERLAHASIIVENYFGENSSRPVALAPHLLVNIRAAIEAASVDEMLFSHARQEIIDNMDTSIFDDFKKSTKYANALAKLVCLTELPAQLNHAMKAHFNFHVFKHRPSHEIVNHYRWVSASPR